MSPVVCCCILLSSCEQNNQKIESEKYDDKQIGQYVYVDFTNTLHVNKDCLIELINANGGLESSHNYIVTAYGVKFIDTLDLTHYVPYGLQEENEVRYLFCPRCVSDDNYERIQKIIIRNTGDLRNFHLR